MYSTLPRIAPSTPNRRTELIRRRIFSYILMLHGPAPFHFFQILQNLEVVTSCRVWCPFRAYKFVDLDGGFS
jgi:hypothetical protein